MEEYSEVKLKVENMLFQDYYNTPGVRRTCHDVKQTADVNKRMLAVKKIAGFMIKTSLVKPGDILIPAPQHTGEAEYTKAIAEMVALKTGATTRDILKCKKRPTLYAQKLNGEKPAPMLYLSDIPPKEGRLFFVDNVISTGATFIEAKKLLGDELIPLVYAVDFTRTRPESW